MKRIEPGEIAVINHRDLDRVAADGLVDAGVVAVRQRRRLDLGPLPERRPDPPRRRGHPSRRPDRARAARATRRGRRRRASPGRRGVARRRARRQRASFATRTRSRRPWTASRATIGSELERFADNTLEYIAARSASITFEPLELPPLHTEFKGRHALVVVRGLRLPRATSRALRPYIREYRPVLIGVDGGADALLEIGLKPDIIIGDFDSVSRPRCAVGAELVHHVHLDGRAPGRENLRRMGCRVRGVRRRRHERGRRDAPRRTRPARS